MFDEVNNGLYYFEHSLWEVVPRIYADLERALERSYLGQPFDVPALLRFGSWMGGDRDGYPRRSIRLRNPYVDPMSLVQVTTLRRMRGLGEDDPQHDAVADLVALCGNEIAAGLQNTG